MKYIQTNQLNIAYRDVGPVNGKPVFLMHGFPYDIHAYDDVSQLLSDQGLRCIIPYLRGYGPTSFRSADSMRSGQQAAIGFDLLCHMDAMDISSAIVAGYDWGGRAATIVAALWPQRVSGLLSCGQGYNIQNIADAANPVLPEEEARYWYQYYFHTERGRSGLHAHRREFCKLLWRLWSPTWAFTENMFHQSASSFDNPDFVEIVIHSYRHRFGSVAGDPAFEQIEQQLATQPDITVPSIVLQGGDDDVDPPGDVDHDAVHFSGPYDRRIIPGAGHNLPQELPENFASAIMELS